LPTASDLPAQRGGEHEVAAVIRPVRERTGLLVFADQLLDVAQSRPWCARCASTLRISTALNRPGFGGDFTVIADVRARNDEFRITTGVRNVTDTS
jgi:hypothetical protein